MEIAERLAQGESSLAIEDDMAERFGERVRAVPRASDPRQSMALLIVAAMALALFVLFSLARRWRRPARVPDEARSEYDEQLDEELARRS